MPAVSKKQYRYFKAVESGDVKGKGAPTKEVAREFTQGVKPSKLPEKKGKKP